MKNNRKVYIHSDRSLFSDQRGLGLVEVIAALGISVVVLTSLVALSLFTLKSSLQSKLLLEGTKVANRELELVRAFRDGRAWEDTTNGTGFLDLVKNCYGANPCHMTYSGGIGVTTGSFNEGTGAEIVTRSFRATKINGNQLVSGDTTVRVSVEVSWAIGGDRKYARLYTDLTNWQ